MTAIAPPSLAEAEALAKHWPPLSPRILTTMRTDWAAGLRLLTDAWTPFYRHFYSEPYGRRGQLLCLSEKRVRQLMEMVPAGEGWDALLRIAVVEPVGQLDLFAELAVAS